MRKGASYKRGSGRYTFRGARMSLERISGMTGIPRGTLNIIARNAGSTELTEVIANALKRREKNTCQTV